MDYGIADIIAADSWKLVRRAEQLGFSPAWFYDSLLFVTDISVAMAAASRPQRFFAKTLGSKPLLTFRSTTWT